MPLQIRRGTAAERTALTSPLVVGELLYVTDQGKIYIGDGTAIGAADIVGNPGQGGKGLIVTGFTVEEAQDATAALFASGTHNNIVFIYNDALNSLSAQIDLSSYNGNITVEGLVDADFKGSVFADDSALLIDASDRKFFGDLEGNVVGSVIGDLKGSIFGDDSTLLVDGTNSVIPAAVVSGTFVGNVVGNVTGGVVSGSIVTNSISSSDSSTIFVDTPINFETDIQVDGNSTFLDELSVTTTANNQRLISLSQVHDSTASSSGIVLRRSRGSYSSLSTVANGDNLGNVAFTGFDGTIYSQGAVIRATTDGTVASGRVPSKLEFLTVSEFSGLLSEKMFIGSRNDVRINAELFVNSSSYDASPMTEFRQAHSTADARNFNWVRSRGTIDAPLAVQNGDGIADLIFAGHDGVNSLPQVSAVIEVVVEGAVTTGRVPGAFFFSTHDGTSLLNRVVISSSGLLTALNNLATPNIAPVVTNGDLALDPASKGLGTIDFKVPEQSTVGAAGAASALPATPSTYLKVKINGNTYVIPAYLAA
jgi:hypothetical protein